MYYHSQSQKDYHVLPITKPEVLPIISLYVDSHLFDHYTLFWFQYGHQSMWSNNLHILQIPIRVDEIKKTSHSVKAGVADAYYYDYGEFFTSTYFCSFIDLNLVLMVLIMPRLLN